jgi:hypothetical protein
MNGPPPKLPWQARTYDTSRRLFERSVIAARSVLVGIGLGLLDRQALHAIDELYYHRQRKYHDESYNLSGLLPWEADVIERHFQGCRSVLLTGAGAGREAIALEQRGLEVAAFECHPELVHFGNELLARRKFKSRIVLAPRDECPPDAPICDAAIAGWASYMMIQPRTVRIRFLQQLQVRLPNDAPLLLSFFARDFDAQHWRLAATIANGFRRIRRRSRTEVGDDLAPNFVHYFSEAEIAAELEAGGFRMVEFSKSDYPHAVGRAVVTHSSQPVVSVAT